MRQAINVLTIQEEVSMDTLYTLQAMINKQGLVLPTMFEHFANPMVHPVTGETISSYKKLMNNPATAEVWQTAFGKDFGGMAQGDNKTGQKGTNEMFVMTHNKIKHTMVEEEFFTYMNPVVNFCTQKEDPHQIWITAGGNLIKYDLNASVHTAVGHRKTPLEQHCQHSAGKIHVSQHQKLLFDGILGVLQI
jgi:hypothetical protein